MNSIGRDTALIMAENKVRGDIFSSNIFLNMNMVFCRLRMEH
jgi:hypothetical protein